MSTAPQPSIPPDDADASDPLARALRAAAPPPAAFSETLHQRALARIAAEPVVPASTPWPWGKAKLAAALAALAAGALLATGVWRNPTPTPREAPLTAASTATTPAAAPTTKPNLAAAELAGRTLAAARAFERRMVGAQRLLTSWKAAPAPRLRTSEAPRRTAAARGLGFGWNLVRKELAAVDWIGTAPRPAAQAGTLRRP